MHCTLIRDLDKNQQINKQDRGLHYGDGIFETMLLEDGEIKYWSSHYKRLSSSAFRLDIYCPKQKWFEDNLKPYFDLKETLVIKIILTRGSGGRGLEFIENMQSNVYLLKYKYQKTLINQTIKAIISQVTLPSNKNLAGLKHLNRLDYVLATKELKSKTDFNEALLFDQNGFLVETIVNNIFFIKNDVIFTPELKSSGVEGVMRNLILKKLKQLKKEVKIGYYLKDDILAADECFLCNSVQGIRSIIQVEDKKFSTGTITKDLQNIFHGHSGN